MAPLRVQFQVALVAASLQVSAADRASLSLNGEWGLTLDPHPQDDRTGLTWWSLPSQPSALPAFNRSNATIQVPGRSVGAAGFGAAGPGRKHVYTGSAWYTKSVALPASWASLAAPSSMALTFGGVFRSMQVWVNGEAVGAHYGYMDPFEFDITAQAAQHLVAASGSDNRGASATTLEIVARVSGIQNCTFSGDCLAGCFDLADGIGSWMGIWGDVAVVVRHHLSTKGLHVRMLHHHELAQQHANATDSDVDASVSVTGTIAGGAAADTQAAVTLSCVVHAHVPGLG
eukprot:SAG31_NODE_10486_length_1132_cov_1.868345_1_plen_286_part_01